MVRSIIVASLIAVASAFVPAKVSIIHIYQSYVVVSASIVVVIVCVDGCLGFVFMK